MTPEIEWPIMVMTLLGGLAMFLFGMELMSDALKNAAGDKMKNVLATLTTNKFMGVGTGTVATMVIQSSSVTTVLMVGFVSAGLMNMEQSIGVILGAHIGTTVTAQIVAFKITKAALAMIAIGFGMVFTSKNERIKQYGSVLLGLGLVFYGMTVMSDAMKPLRDYQPFLNLMAQMDNPLMGILVATAFTGLIQSSSATTGIVIVMASQGFISLEAGIALTFGANVGTCVTAGLAAIGKPRAAVQVAAVHVIIQIAGVLVWLPLITPLAEFVTWLSPAHTELSGTARLAAETPRQIANAHTVFNTANTFLFIWFTSYLAKLVNYLVPLRDEEPEERSGVIVAKPQHLSESLLSSPPAAFLAVRREIEEMGSIVQEMLRDSIHAFFSKSSDRLEKVSAMDDNVDTLYTAIVAYIKNLTQGRLSDLQAQEANNLLTVVNDLESIGDMIETDTLYLKQQLTEKGIEVSEQTQDVLFQMHAVVAEAVANSVTAVAGESASMAKKVRSMKSRVQMEAAAAEEHLRQRLTSDDPNRVDVFAIETEMVERLRRIYYFAKRIANTARKA